MWQNESVKNNHNKEIRTMAYHDTILRQLIDIFPRHKFESIAIDYHRGKKFRSFNPWSQFLILFIGQISGRKSLRDLVMNISTQYGKLDHLEIRPCSRATLARVNEQQSVSMYEELFDRLLHRTKFLVPKHRFKFKGKLSPWCNSNWHLPFRLSVKLRGLSNYMRGLMLTGISLSLLISLVEKLIKLFFKWIKQNLRIKTFLGTFRNAVLTQIWIDLIAYLLLAFLKFKTTLGISMQQILRVLQLKLSERRDFMELLKPP